ncbi:MAG TPA: M28 family peptidase, partial [Nitrolancea sp.]|nr:M28 family peptidase [Nitrolancea sp.]
MKSAPALKQPRHRHRWQVQRPLALPAGGIAALPALTLLAILAVLVWVGLRPLATPAVVPATAPATTFSAERAMAHLRVIAAQPHAIGSPENAAVRQYLVEQVRALGLEPEIQTTSQAVAEGEEAFRAGVVDNIIVRVPGMRSTGAIAIDAHYDSVNTGPGAGDCGSCVVTALEALRAVVAGPALQNDLLFVFSDGEERHMLGAAAFNQQHPLAGDVRLALNFEAQGSGGPAFLYVTSPDDRWLVSQFLAVAPDASAYSLLASISDLYPAGRFDSDLGWYTERGSQGLGVIFTADTPAYHTDRDNPNVIDPGSIQQEGAYTLALARHFGNLDLTTMPAAAGDSVFFTVWPGVVVHYPFSWTLPLAAVITVLVAGLLFLGVRRQELTSGGLVLGLVSFVTGSLVTVLAATGIWFAVRTLNGAYQVHMAGSYQSGLYQVALILASIALMTGFYTLLGRKVRRHNLVAGALLGWTLLLWLLSLTVPGISYLATWPLLFALLPPAWSALACSRASQPWWQVLILAIAAVPALVLLPGTLHQMAALINRFEGVLDFPLLGIVMVVVAPLLALFLPHLHFLAGDPGGPRRWAVPAATALVALALIGWGNATS